MIGYWKAQILRRFPNRAIQDSHTPQVLKIQILLLAALMAAILGLFISSWSWILVLAAVLVFYASTIPFLLKAWKKDKPVFFISPVLLVARAAALGFGYAWGLLKPSENIRQEHTIHGFRYVVKRLVDICGSLFGLVITLILAPFIGLAIKLDSHGPVIFKQERVGEEGRTFKLYKFRSMQENAEEELLKIVDLEELSQPVFKQKNDPRLTRVGRVLRRWSLDELPQFWNVLKGEMSLVGPRPEETRYVTRYNDWQRRRLAVKPGMTGPMQVSGRGDLSLNDRVELELEYINHYTLKKDLIILLKTIPAILKGMGAH